MHSLNLDSPMAAEYAALKTANDLLRERAKQQLFGLLDLISAELSHTLVATPGGQPLEVGRQDWQFKEENSTMVGERFGARQQGRTLLVEVGWPREPQHGYVTNGGLARARVSLSQNVMLEPQVIAEFILRRQGTAELQWQLLAGQRQKLTPGDPVTEMLLRSYFQRLLVD